MAEGKKQEFACKWKIWLARLINDEFHAIRNQVHDLLWDYAVFISINKLRGISKINPRKSVGFNNTVLRLLDSGFVATQVMRVRRLTEKKCDDEKKEVISLRGLIKNLKENRTLITRENYITINNWPYDYDDVRFRELNINPSKSNAHVDKIKSNDSYPWALAEYAHHKFDELSGVHSHNRHREDIIKEEYFKRLEDSLSICDNLREYSHKYIAHAASLSSRRTLTDKQTIVTLEQLKNCHKRIYQVTNSILEDIFQDSMGRLPAPAFALFKNLEKGWATKSNFKDLDEVRANYEKEVAKW